MYRKYTINEDLFKVWSEDSAYLLGFLLADGCVQHIPNKKYSIRFELKDIDALETLKDIAGSTAIIKETNYKESPLYLLIFQSKEWVKDLQALGVGPNKAHRLALPNIPKEYIKFLILGFFDGDGSVYINRNKKGSGRLVTSFCSVSRQFLVEIGEFLRNEIEIIPKIYESRPLFYKLTYGGKESYAMYRYLYTNATRFLARKKAIFDLAISKNIGTYITNCCRCNKEITRTSGRTRWCSNCKPTIKKEQCFDKDQRRKEKRRLNA